MKKPELLSPAGDFERLVMAVHYGADAVYLGGTAFSMRKSPPNFNGDELKKSVEYAHSRGVRVYLTLNTLPRNDEIRELPAFIGSAAEAGVDAFIITDLGVMEQAKRYAPEVEIHISTQAGIVNYASANAFFGAGAKRIVLARELSLGEIAEIRRNTPGGLEIEAFVHGAMCVSFSGRCLLSSYLTGRDANRGDCAQPCRWNYHLMEETREGRYFPVFEDEKGTHILNSKDLCMIAHLPELIDAGVDSFKIEGRAKSAYYTAAVTNAYRLAIDACFDREGAGKKIPDLLGEVEKVSHRDYCTGFFFGPIQNGQSYHSDIYQRKWDVVAVVESCGDGRICLSQRNSFRRGDRAEVLEPGQTGRPIVIGELFDENGRRVEQAARPEMKVWMESEECFPASTIIRKICE